MQNTSLRRIRVIDLSLVILFTIIAIITIYPFWHCLVGSVTPYHIYMQKVLLLWPDRITFDAYKFILQQGQIYNPLLVTAIITIIGTFANVFITTFVAYGLSKKFPGRGLILYMIVLTMFVNAGLVPNYLLFRNLHLINSLGVYIIPSLINTFYLIIIRTYFLNFSTEIEEAAYIDGYSGFGIFFKIILPLSKPMIAAIALFTAVDYWNTFSQSIYYITDFSKKTLQDYLYMMLSDNTLNTAGTGSTASSGTMGKTTVFSETIKLANTIISVVPILIVYPFLQRYFTSGIMVGAIKG